MKLDARDHPAGKITARAGALRRIPLLRIPLCHIPLRIGTALAVAALALCISLSAHATSSLSFWGDGYWLDFEIGHDRAASIKFFAPGDRTGVVLRENLGVEVFDVAARSLVVSCKGNTQVPAFRLTVRGEEATLEVDGKRVVSKFSWEM